MSLSEQELKRILSEKDVELIIKARRYALSLSDEDNVLLNMLKQKLSKQKVNLEDLEESLLNNLYPLPVAFNMSQQNMKQYAPIFENFQSQFGEQNIIQDNILTFETMEIADKFFRAQAVLKIAFLFQGGKKIHEDEFEWYDHYAFSDGHGNYKMGTMAEITAFCKSNEVNNPFIEEHLGANPNARPLIQ